MHAILRARERARCRGRMNERARGRRERECAHAREKVLPCARGGLGCKTWPMGLAMKKAAKTLPLTDGCAESSMKHGAIH